MGGAVGVPSGQAVDANAKLLLVTLRKLPDAIEESLFVEEKFPLILDPTEQASRFLKYQTGTYIMMDDPVAFTVENIKRAYVNSLRYGRIFTIKTKSLQLLLDFFISNGLLNKFLCRNVLYSEELWKPLLGGFLFNLYFIC